MENLLCCIPDFVPVKGTEHRYKQERNFVNYCIDRALMFLIDKILFIDLRISLSLFHLFTTMSIIFSCFMSAQIVSMYTYNLIIMKPF